MAEEIEHKNTLSWLRCLWVINIVNPSKANCYEFIFQD